MTPGSQAAPGVFCCAPPANADWRCCATVADRSFWSAGNAGALWFARRGATADGRNVSVRHAAYQSDGMLSARTDRPVYAEPHGDFARLADGDYSWILRWVHDVFKLWVGNGENAGRRRVDESDNVRGSERGSRTSAFGRG